MGNLKAFFRSNWFLYLLLALFSIALTCFLKSYDYSLFTNLIFGEKLINSHDFIYQDYLSFLPTHIWINQNWGFGGIEFLFHKTFGNFGLILLQASILFLTAVFVIKTQKLNSKSFSLSFISIFLGLFVLLNTKIGDPQIISFLFFTVFLFILEKTRIQNSNLVWTLPLLIILWNNINTGVVSGLCLILVYFFSSIFSKKLITLKYLAVFVLSTAAVLITPYGIDYIDFLPINYILKYDLIEDWKGVITNHSPIDYFIILAGLFTFTLNITNSIKDKKIEITKEFLLILSILISIIQPQYLTLVLIIVSTLYYNEIANLLSIEFTQIGEKIFSLLVILTILAIPFTHPLEAKIKNTQFPIVETEFLKSNDIKGNIISDIDLGGYIAYRLYPNNNIYADNRDLEVYYEDFLVSYEKFITADSFWFLALIETPVDIIVIRKDNPVCKELDKDKDWKLLFAGPVCNIYSFGEIANKTYNKPDFDEKYYNKTAFNKITDLKGINNEQ